MDKIDALKIAKTYLKRVRDNKIKFTEAWLFGSYAQGNQHEDSDIDLAIVLENEEKKCFSTEVKLMIIRENEETLIEPHLFSQEEFNSQTPIINQIIQKGEKVIFSF
jgi:predicted nucleotidyltransferase